VLAHELTHVVQQRTGPVDATPRPDGVRISDPGDRFEQAAEAKADAVMSAPPGAAPSARGGPRAAPARRGVVQRFLAGEAGHGGVEEEALQEAGLSKQEAHQTYFGNWMRDFSQKLDPDNPSGGVWLGLIYVLATGEFGREPTKEELGQYLPSEHVDNPMGGKSAEAPVVSEADKKNNKTAADRQQHELWRSHLSKTQQAWLKEEESTKFKTQIAAASAKTGLPDYIERAKEHVRRQLGKAAQLGRTPEGERELGNGLHAVEDYFAHSNFVEVALAELVPKDVDRANPLVRALAGYYDVVPDQVPVDNLGRPGIITGTSAPGPGDKVGKWEVIKAELRNAEIRKALVRGLSILYAKAARERDRNEFSLVGHTVGGFIGAVGGAVGGLFSGAASGAAAGWRGARHWWQKPFAAIGGLFKGAATGAVHGAASGAKAGSHVGEKVGAFLGDVIGRVEAAFVTAFLYALFVVSALALTVVGPILEVAAPHRIRTHTRETVDQTVDPTRAKQPTTHSQIAKDDIDHPMHNAAAALAHEADLNIGKVMIDVWAHKRPVSDAEKLVDLYMAHPKANRWWQPTLIKAAKAAAAAAKVPMR
jgi:Heterokaryon incompatibility protein Het-C